MRYDDQDRESKNVEDRRGQGGGGMFRFPGGFGRRGGRGGRIQLPIGRGRGRGGFSITTLIIIGVVMWMLGFNPLTLLTGGGPGGGGLPDISQVPQMPKFDRSQPRQANRESGGFQFPTPSNSPAGGKASSRSSDQLASFTKKVLADTEDVWNRVFKSVGQQYREPKLVLFSGSTQTACGQGQAAMGPFYCPVDQKVYLDMRFYQELNRKFGAPGDFAQAYVIAHEVGHHVQKLLGIADQVLQLKRRHPRSANQIQVRMELQADCLSGVWANLNDALKNRLEPGDIEEGLRAANAIGDDMIQKRQQGYVVPDAFTHGSSEQRVRWFSIGFKSGRIDQCNTFNAKQL